MLSDHLAAINKMVKGIQLEIPVLVDTMENTFLKLYAPWPFHFFVIIDSILKLVWMLKDEHYDMTNLVKCLDAFLNSKKD